MQVQVGHGSITLVQGDITHQDVDAIVNAANKTLLGGGGVDGAIHQAAGPELLAECKRIRKEVLGGAYVETAQPVMTNGYRLKARHVIHVVGPICGIDPHPDRLLAAAYRNCLQLAAEAGLKSVAFPSISTGAFGCDVRWASRIALGTIVDFLRGVDATGADDKEAVERSEPAEKSGLRARDATASHHGPGGIAEVRMVLFTRADYDVYVEALEAVLAEG
ncbi:macro domain-containing protein [Alicyclobacillus macrosporangiidus]|uniref:O-acetyl-ADP-ribose deacetylase (Regulator of RNase III), contains Macro domain n=1 Tax=Alicyclobacillus macrosporangiidus TaxID=392015 RepID=A0A1I7L6E7_9BACL|nr:macro domain-containing protein [Alicyclobacillus macrosporangiidus]SFV05297.1 O-acetyl-ADP-ribose deacetylase (regulator of RNase III), contains Macro domain [Alicyclobacillus macrosporangiidus]